jgi:hypothetical protein
MNSAYSNTTIGVEEFEKLHQEGIAISPHVVKENQHQIRLQYEEPLMPGGW